jgi:Ran GTPase-activating protein (RanGAP) involved in mRNA processing and transport
MLNSSEKVLTFNSRIFDRNQVKHRLELELKEHPDVERVYIGGYYFGDAMIKDLIDVLMKFPKIQAIDLSANKIGDDGAKYISEVLKKNTSVEVVGLANNKIGGDGAKCLSDLLVENQTIAEVDLRNNIIGDDGAKYLSDLLVKNHTIAKVDLRNNIIGDDGVKCLSNGLETNKTVKTLILSGNHICNNGAKYISEVLKKNTIIEWMDLSANEIGDDGVKYLSEGLKINKTLQILMLNGNIIGDDGVKCLSNGLETNKTVKTLILSGNKIGDTGVERLSEMLKNNTAIKWVDLSYNQIGDVGAKCLSDLLKVNKTIKELTLSWNKIGDIGVKHMLEALKSNACIKNLFLRGNVVSRKGAKYILDWLKRSSSKTHLWDWSTFYFQDPNGWSSGKSDNVARYIGAKIDKIIIAQQDDYSDKFQYPTTLMHLSQIGGNQVIPEDVLFHTSKFLGGDFKKGKISEQKAYDYTKNILTEVDRLKSMKCIASILSALNNYQHQPVEKTLQMKKMAKDIKEKLAQIDNTYISRDTLTAIHMKLEILNNEFKSGSQVKDAQAILQGVQKSLEELWPALKKQEVKWIASAVKSILDKLEKYKGNGKASIAEATKKISAKFEQIKNIIGSKDDDISLGELKGIRTGLKYAFEDFDDLTKEFSDMTRQKDSDQIILFFEGEVLEMLNGVGKKIDEVESELNKRENTKNLKDFMMSREGGLGHF